MAEFLLLFWALTIAGIWVCAFLCFRQTIRFPEPGSERSPLIPLSLFVATLPPTLIAAVTIAFLFHAAPTAQFNVGNNNGMDWWSFWVHNYLLILGCSGLQLFIYLIWWIILLCNTRLRLLRPVLGFSLLASIISSYILLQIPPTA